MNFKGLKDLEPVDDFYNGGAGGFGSTSTQNYGATFSGMALAIQSYVQKGAGGFASPPKGTPALFFSTGTTGYVNIAGGFTAGTNFYYTGTQTVATVWSGTNGTGTVLATVTLSDNSGPANGCPSFPTYCNWTLISLPFSGNAQSVTFSGQANQFGVASITIGSP